MKDRNVEFPQRYHLRKVEGTDDIYDIIPAPGEVSDEGTLINKNTLLKDTTAALLDLDSLAVPDDAFRQLGNFRKNIANGYLWAKYSDGSGTVDPMVSVGTIVWEATVQYADSFTVADGVASLVSPQTFVANSVEAVSVLPGKYFIQTFDGSMDSAVPKGALCYAPADNAISNVGLGYDISYQRVYAQKGFVGYVSSTDSTAYPPAVDDGFTYEALGQLGEKTRIATGFYAGTGAYGSGSPNTLTFDFEPKMVVLVGWNLSNTSSNSPCLAVLVNGFSQAAVLMGDHVGDTSGDDAEASGLAVTFSGNSVSYYSAYMYGQMNSSGCTYHYVAFG